VALDKPWQTRTPKRKGQKKREEKMTEDGAQSSLMVPRAPTKEECAFRDTLVLRLNDLFNNKNFKVVDDVLSEDAINRGPLGQTYGIPEFKNMFCLPLFNGFPDLVFVCHEIVTELPAIVMRWTFTGTHRGEFRGYKPTNQKISWSGVVINRLNESGRVYEVSKRARKNNNNRRTEQRSPFFSSSNHTLPLHAHRCTITLTAAHSTRSCPTHRPHRRSEREIGPPERARHTGSKKRGGKTKKDRGKGGKEE
jgi:predicted ester cyclase